MDSALDKSKSKKYILVDMFQAPRKCELNCMPKGERFYLMQAKKVN